MNREHVYYASLRPSFTFLPARTKGKFLFWLMTDKAIVLLSIFPSEVPLDILQFGSGREIGAVLMGKCQHIKARKEETIVL